MGLGPSIPEQQQKKNFPRTSEDKRLDKYTEAFVFDKPYKKPRTKFQVVDVSGREKFGYKEKRKVFKKIEQRSVKHPPTEKPIELKKMSKPPKIKDDLTPEEKKKIIPQSSDLNERLEKALARSEKIQKSLPLKSKLPFRAVRLTGRHRSLLFINPSDESIEMCIYSLNNDFQLPKWAVPLILQLSASEDRLFFNVDGKDLPFAFQFEKRKAVKKLYFNPKKPSTIQPITDALRGKYCNITKRDVTRILRTFETYQLNFQRRRPPKILGRMSMQNPGVLACDMFFPSKLHGWRKMNCLAVMDTWSRFCRCYALPTKDKKSVVSALTLFCKEFAAHGHLPRRMLADRGTDLRGAYDVMEMYRQAKDKNNPLVLHTAAGTPVNIIEAMNSQIQRRMAVFRTARLTDDPAVLLTDVCDQINNQKRPDRGNLTPLQLLTLSAEERRMVNATYNDRTFIPDVKGLSPLYVGSYVRVLRMTRKEQIQNKVKGFAPKWSKKYYQVRRKVAIPKNNSHFRYYLEGGTQFYYRHELLKIPKLLDKKVPDLIEHNEYVIAPDEDWSAESDPGSD